ncbi:hypothetical protein SAMN06265364_13617 [Prevotella jejuni]|uniref:Uncharacterized protein n=1 Tax=Prevotella jejuni TaxID=1177574 RepID=A0AA94LLM7_9BACT|nr:hypothetical protein SAMN06265364_13617 [Prevotella jejuni]
MEIIDNIRKTWCDDLKATIKHGSKNKQVKTIDIQTRWK